MTTVKTTHGNAHRHKTRSGRAAATDVARLADLITARAPHDGRFNLPVPGVVWDGLREGIRNRHLR
jgi:hypothetical protein